MIHKSLLIIAVLSFCLAFYPVHAASAYAPQAGDYFNYHEVENLGNGTGSYAGYTEQTIIDGKETMNSIDTSQVVSATYGYTWSFTNSSGSNSGSDSGSFTFSAATFLYINGTDDQNGYVNPTVWFYIDDSTPKGGTFSLLNTQTTVMSTNYGYYLPSEGRNVKAIFTQGTSSYERNDAYGQFTATYTWKAYFDPSTGYIIGYDYVEHDTSPTGDGFTYTDDLYVTQTSYSLTAATAGSSGSGNSTTNQYIDLTVAIVVIIALIAIIAYAVSRRSRKLPKHPTTKEYVPPPPSPPPSIDLTPKQPPVQQIVIKEVVKVNCRYCGALIDSTATVCPVCGAPRN